MKFTCSVVSAATLVLCSPCSAQLRINHAGRILGNLPTVTTPILFNTAQADAVLSAMQIFPTTNAWNEDVSKLPVLANSAQMIQQITSDLRSDRQHLEPEFEMNFVLVPNSQQLQPINFYNYPDESDPSPYPIPDNTPVEPWPIGYGVNGESLYQWQMDGANSTDAHAIVVQPNAGYSWETWLMQRNADKSWQASNGAKFNLASNAQRPLGWTSGDAAGLSMLPALVRYDEAHTRGSIEHALRLVVKYTRQQYIYPASHWASSIPASSTQYPAMGQRLRLKSSFVVPSTWTTEEKAVCAALKKYGGLVADNGNFFSFSITPDDRWAAGAFDDLNTIPVSAFEVVQSTGPTGGPRSPNPPVCDAGADQTISAGASATLNGSVSGGVGTLVQGWYKYSGPGTVTFANASSPATSATFSTVGDYMLMLKADDGVHTPGYSACTIHVQSGSSLPSVTGFGLSSSSKVGGNTVTGNVYLSAAAPSGGSVVALSSSNVAVAKVAQSVTVLAGRTSASFPIYTYGVSATTAVTFTASYNGTSKSAGLYVLRASLLSLNLASGAVSGGSSDTGTVWLNGEAGPGGVSVALSSSNPNVASVATPLSIPSGYTHMTFPVHTAPVANSQAVTLTATFGGLSRTASVTVSPS